MRPLLVASADVYVGPWVPAGDMLGIVRAEGLASGEDEVIVDLRDASEEDDDSQITFTMDGEVRLTVKSKTLIRARRVRSSGREISIWVQ